MTHDAAPPPPQPGEEGYSAPVPLPEGWEEQKDAATGQAYFFNAATGESSWVRPEGDKV